VYKLLLCWRYLRTRYLAMVCIVSVMLGVGTLIVVNAVMAGFSTKLRERLHDLLSDIVIEAYDYDGFPDPNGKMAMICQDKFLGPRIEAITPTLEIFAMFQFSFQGAPMTKPIKLIGIDPVGRTQTGGFAGYLKRDDNKVNPTFNLTPDALRRYNDNRLRFAPQMHVGFLDMGGAELSEPVWQQPDRDWRPDFIRELDKERRNDRPTPIAPQVEHHPSGIIIGYSLAHFRERQTEPGVPGKEVTTLEEGAVVSVMTLNSQWKPVDRYFVVADYFQSGLSEYDAQYAFLPLLEVQTMRNLPDRATSLQIKLKDYDDAKEVTDYLKRMFAHVRVEVETWEDKQGPILSAIKIERGILNVLLFMIVGVAGFGILAIFSMIVVEKTRDIGIMKALGASNWGILNIFLGYGFLLGLVGSLLGTLGGLLFTWNINGIEKWLSRQCGIEVFSGNVYYFTEIPTSVQPMTVFLINVGSLGIAVIFSVLPALRAALLHPVQALRGE
jgi:lipoprotein-releasing system permease protein